MTEPNPLNPISWLVILLLGLAFFVVLGLPVSTTASVQVMPVDPAGNPVQPSVVRPPADSRFPERANAEYLGVEKVAVTVREFAPQQVTVTINGYWSNGCSAEPDIDMAVEGNNVTIAVSRTIPPDVMCTMVLQEAEIQVDITDLLVQNNIRSGQFTVTVNGFAVGTRF